MENIDKAMEYEINDPNILYSVYVNKAYALTGLQKFEESLEYSNKAIELNPQDCKGYVNKSSALIKLSKYDEAIECCNTAIESNIEDYLLYNMGLLLKRRASLNKLCRHIQKVRAQSG